MYALAVMLLPNNPAAPMPPWYLWATEDGIQLFMAWADADNAGLDLATNGRYDYRVVGAPIIAVEPEQLPAN